MNDAPTTVRLIDPATPLDDHALDALYQPPDQPWLRVNFVTSVDGAVEIEGRSGGLSGPLDQRVLSMLRTQCDALLLGAGTLRIEGYGSSLLTAHWRDWRRAHGRTAHPTLVLVSGRLALDPAWPVFTDAPARPVVLTHADSPADRRAALSQVADVLVTGAERVDLAAGLDELRQRGFSHLLCEGGPHLFGSLTAADLVDEVCLTVSPLLAGAGAGRIIAGPGASVRRLSLRQVLADNGMLFLRYQRRNHRR